MKNKKILVAMSGGVDSSVAAALLKNYGFEVTGAFMVNWHEHENGQNKCVWEKEYSDARRVAAKIGIKLFSWDFSKEYKKLVFDYFISAYEKGLTPNPDTLCNKHIKFGLFLEKAKSLGFDKIATGHYSRTRKQENKETRKQTIILLTAKDKTKDQSYFLYELGQKELEQVIFPIGDLTKKYVRQLAKKFDLPVEDKKDSYGICYIGEKNMKDFLGQFLKENTGEIVNASGKILAKHKGLHFYTLGQRQRIGIGGTGPYYVLNKDIKKNQLIVTDKPNDQGLFKKEIYVKNPNWISKSNPKQGLKCYARFRHLQKLQKAEICLKDNKILVRFKKPQKAPAEGQAVVFYKRLNFLSKDFEVSGGGIIC